MQTTAQKSRRRKPAALARLAAGLRWLIRLEWLAVMVAAPLLLFPTFRPFWTAVALGGLVVLWLLRWLLHCEPWPVTPFTGTLLLFVLMVPVAIWASAFPELTLPKAAGLVLGLATFRATALAVRNRRSLGLALTILCLLGLTVIVVGALGIQWSVQANLLGLPAHRIPYLITSLPDLHSTGINPNQLAGALALYLPLAVGLVIGLRPQRRPSAVRLFVFVGALVFLSLAAAALLLTQSRGGWIGGVVGLLALWMLWGLNGRRRWGSTLGVALPLLALVVVLVFLLYLGPYRVGEILYKSESDTLVEEVVGEITITARIEIWSRALYAIQDFSFTGCGLGAFRRVVHLNYPLFLIPPDHDIAHAHNIFLQTALDLGLPGLIAYLAFLGLAGVVCWRCARQGSPLVRATALGLAAGLMGLHFYGLADALALGSKPGVAFWFALGLIAALPRVVQQETSEPEDAHATRITQYVSRLTHHARTHPWSTVAVVFLAIALLAAGICLGWRELRSAQPVVRLPLYPAAQKVEVRTENPPDGSDWTGMLEVAAFSTTDPIADVATFYANALAEAGWKTEIEAGDATSWGGIYIQNGGLSVCLLNAFDSDGETRVSIVCGDKAEPVDLPP